MSAGPITLPVKGAFSLAASIRFHSGFTPLTGGEAVGDHDDGTMRLAFAVERDWRAAGVSVRQAGDGTVTATVVGDADRAAVAGQTARMLSLDVDASSLERAVSHDEVASGLVARSRGLRPVCFPSPYEAAGWAVLSQRVQMRQAAVVRARMCARLGRAVEVNGRALQTFPAPETLRRTAAVEGLAALKVERLRGVAGAALEGRLDAAALRAAGPETALAAVQELAGIGPFGAELVVVRGAGEPDHFSRTERRLHAAMADAYGLDGRDVDALAAIADGWRPFRSWIGFLFRAQPSPRR